MNYLLLVHWPGGKTELVNIPPDGEVTIGDGGDPATPVEFYDERENMLGRLTVCGEEHPTWMVCRKHPEPGTFLRSVSQPLWDSPQPWDEERTQPDAIVSILDLNADEVSENDGRRIHALADLLTAQELLAHLVERDMAMPECWSEPGRMRRHIDTARQHLQTILSCAEFLTETTADVVDLSLAEAELHNPSTAFELDFMRKAGKA
jgi:hypothetical protein